MVTDCNQRGQHSGTAVSDDIRFDSWLQSLRASGYRLTEPRLLLIDLIASAQRVLSAEQLYELAQSHSAELGKATVYRTLEKLEELGLIQRVHDAHGCHTFAPVQVGQPQILIFCQLCGRLDYLAKTSFQQMLAAIQTESGWQVQEHRLQFSGICGECSELKANPQQVEHINHAIN